MTAPAGPASDGSLWVFGYGSLMWRPGFAYARRCKATLRGWRRSLCVFSHVYRGSPERPGLVLGLDRGGACQGVAFEVASVRPAQGPAPCGTPRGHLGAARSGRLPL